MRFKTEGAFTSLSQQVAVCSKEHVASDIQFMKSDQKNSKLEDLQSVKLHSKCLNNSYQTPGGK